MDENDGCLVMTFILIIGVVAFGGCNRMNELDRRLKRVESEYRSLEYDLDKLKRERQTPVVP